MPRKGRGIVKRRHGLSSLYRKRHVKPYAKKRISFNKPPIAISTMRGGKLRRKRMRGGNFWDDFKKGFHDGFGFVMDTANQAMPLVSKFI